MKVLFHLLFLCAFLNAGALDFFHKGSFLYVQGKMEEAKASVMQGLREYPANQKLERLKERIEEAIESQKQQDQKQDQNKDGEKENDQKKDSKQNQEESSQDENQEQSGENQNSSGEQSSSESSEEQASPSSAGANSSTSQEGEEQRPPEAPTAQERNLDTTALSPAEVERLLEQFDEENANPNKKYRGKPLEKDW